MNEVEATRAERLEDLRQKLHEAEIVSLPDGFVRPLCSEVERIIQVVSEWLWSE